MNKFKKGISLIAVIAFLITALVPAAALAAPGPIAAPSELYADSLIKASVGGADVTPGEEGEDPASITLGQTATLSAAWENPESSGGSALTGVTPTYAWSAEEDPAAGLPNNITSATANNIDVTPTATGEYTYTITASGTGLGTGGADKVEGTVGLKVNAAELTQVGDAPTVKLGADTSTFKIEAAWPEDLPAAVATEARKLTYTAVQKAEEGGGTKREGETAGTAPELTAGVASATGRVVIPFTLNDELTEANIGEFTYTVSAKTPESSSGRAAGDVQATGELTLTVAAADPATTTTTAAPTAIASGQTSVLTATLTDAAAGAAYTWEKSTDEGSTWETVGDADITSGTKTGTLAATPETTLSLTVKPAADTQYRCVVVNPGADQTSSEEGATDAAVTVSSLSVADVTAIAGVPTDIVATWDPALASAPAITYTVTGASVANGKVTVANTVTAATPIAATATYTGLQAPVEFTVTPVLLSAASGEVTSTDTISGAKAKASLTLPNPVWSSSEAETPEGTRIHWTVESGSGQFVPSENDLPMGTAAKFTPPAAGDYTLKAVAFTGTSYAQTGVIGGTQGVSYTFTAEALAQGDITVDPTEAEVQIGQSQTLTAKAANDLGTPVAIESTEGTWTATGSEGPVDLETVFGVTDSTSPSIDITPAEDAATGSYTFTYTLGEKNGSSAVTVVAAETAPVLTTTSSKNVSVPEGNPAADVTFAVTVDPGNPAATAVWESAAPGFNAGTMVGTDGSVQTLTLDTSYLAGLAVGTYTFTCTAENSVGSSSQVLTVTVVPAGTVVVNLTGRDSLTYVYGSASGSQTWEAAVSPAGTYTYQWTLDGEPLQGTGVSGATGNSPTLSQAYLNGLDAGAHELDCSITGGTLTETLHLPQPVTITVSKQNITITQSPAEWQLTRVVGTTVPLSVDASPALPEGAAYSWMRSDGTSEISMPDVTGNSYTATVPEAGVAGYECTVSAGSNYAVTQNGLWIISGTRLMSGLENGQTEVAVYPGSTPAPLTAAWTYGEPDNIGEVTFQWKQDGTPLPGNTLTVTPNALAEGAPSSTVTCTPVVNGTACTGAAAEFTLTAAEPDLETPGVTSAAPGTTVLAGTEEHSGLSASAPVAISKEGQAVLTAQWNGLKPPAAGVTYEWTAQWNGVGTSYRITGQPNSASLTIGPDTTVDGTPADQFSTKNTWKSPAKFTLTATWTTAARAQEQASTEVWVDVPESMPPSAASAQIVGGNMTTGENKTQVSFSVPFAGGDADRTTAPLNLNTRPTLTATGVAAGTPNGVVAYLWEYLPTGSSRWTQIPSGIGFAGVQSSTLTLSPLTANMAGWQFRVRASDALNAGDQVTSDPVTLALYDVSSGIAPQIGITAVPGNNGGTISAADGSSVTLNAKIENNIPEEYVSYQWMKKAAPTAAAPNPQWTAVPGASKASLTIDVTEEDNEAQYWCKAVNGDFSTGISNNTTTNPGSVVHLSVHAPNGQVLITSPTDSAFTAVYTGKTVSASVAAHTDDGEEATYQWYEQAVPGVFPEVTDAASAAAAIAGYPETAVAGADSEDFTSPVLTEAGLYAFSCVVTNASNGQQTAQSLPYYVLVTDQSRTPVISQPAAANTIASPKQVGTANGGSITLVCDASVASGEALSYQWQAIPSDSTDNEWDDLPNQTSPTLTLQGVTTTPYSGTRYRCVVTNTAVANPEPGQGQAESGVYILNVWPASDTPVIQSGPSGVYTTAEAIEDAKTNGKSLPNVTTVVIQNNISEEAAAGLSVTWEYRSDASQEWKEALNVLPADPAAADEANAITPVGRWEWAKVKNASGTVTGYKMRARIEALDPVSGAAYKGEGLYVPASGQYRCILVNGEVQGADPTAVSGPAAVSITVKNVPVIAAQPANASAEVGTKATFTTGASVTPGTPVYVWQESKDGGETWTNCTKGSGQFTSSYTTPVLTNADYVSTIVSGPTQYRCLVASRAQGIWVATNPAKLTVTEGSGDNPPPEEPAITPAEDTDLTVSDGVLSGTDLTATKDGNTVSEVLGMLEEPEEGYELRIESADGEPLEDDDIVGTGAQLLLVDTETGDVVEALDIVVRGDVMGTGVLSLTQLVQMAQFHMGERELTDLQQLAGDLNGNGKSCDLTDLVQEAALYTSEVLGEE